MHSQMIFATYLGLHHFAVRDIKTLSERLLTDDLLAREANMDVYLFSQRIVAGDVFYSKKVNCFQAFGSSERRVCA